MTIGEISQSKEQAQFENQVDKFERGMRIKERDLINRSSLT
jgi:hypothetical protein